MSVNQRIKEFQDVAYSTQREFAKEIGISETTLSSVYAREGNPSMKVIEAVIIRFPELNARWLLTGEGQMLLKSEISEQSEISKITEGVIENLQRRLTDLENIIHNKIN